MAAREGLDKKELELEDHGEKHDHAVVGAAQEEADFLNWVEANEFFTQEKQMLSLLQNP